MVRTYALIASLALHGFGAAATRRTGRPIACAGRPISVSAFQATWIGLSFARRQQSSIGAYGTGSVFHYDAKRAVSTEGYNALIVRRRRR